MPQNQQATPNSDRQCWILVGSVGNWHRTQELGFTIQALKARHRKKVSQMRPGDAFTYYCTKVMAFAGTATVTSEYFESTEPIWTSGEWTMPAAGWPFRIRIERDLALEDHDFVDAEPLARQMTYVRKWPPDHWTLAFQGQVHPIPEEDFQLIRRAITRAAQAVPSPRGLVGEG